MNNKILKAREFYNIFIKNIKENHDELLHCCGDRAFTTAIFSILEKILDRMNVKWCREYYNIDLMGYYSINNDKISEDINSINMNYYCWLPYIAIEHENNSREWYDEFIKLLYIRCPLKVIICYNENRELDEEKIKVAIKLARSCGDFYSCCVKDGEFLIIMGNTNKRYYEIGDLEYTGYILNNDKIVKITDKVV